MRYFCCTSIPAMSLISHEISWWNISLVEVIQVIQGIQVMQEIQLIQVMQVRLAHLWPDFWVILLNTFKFNSFLSIFSDFARLAHPCTFSSFQGYWLVLLPSSSCSIFKHCLHWLMVELSWTSNKLATNHTGDYIEQLGWMRAGNLIHPEVGAGPYITYSLLGFYNRHF